ncbi:hypothetical protein CVT26_008637 [Gymnopilus dilepis]|uniref:Uncharacterized protein n=1 Tax=Gymnopilus dilepis TaxID=231916 RepID=A0A409XXW6_9AGAR|nr:hypothetical protein CVT26_008637 [Gymnopilus dilepis]
MSSSIGDRRTVDISDDCPPLTTLSLLSAEWVWTNKIFFSTETALGTRAFRGTLPVPAGHTATGAAITISVDNECTDWTHAQAFPEVIGRRCPTNYIITATIDFTTDRTWKFSVDVPDEFEDPGFDDSAWSTVKVQGVFRVQPWGDIPTQGAQGE